MSIPTFSPVFFAAVYQMPTYTLATIPAATTLYNGVAVIVSDDFEDNAVCYCDGTNWRRVLDNEVIG